MECASPSGADSVKNVVTKNPKTLHWEIFQHNARNFIWFFDNLQFVKKETRHNFVNIAKITIMRKNIKAYSKQAYLTFLDENHHKDTPDAYV